MSEFTRTFTPTLRQNSPAKLTTAQVDANFAGLATAANAASRSYTASSQEAMLALSPTPAGGDSCWRSDLGASFLFLGGDAASIANWATSNIPVKSVFGRMGDVAAKSGDYTVGQVEGALASADLAASGGASLVGFLQQGVGATARTLREKLLETVSVKDFGAIGDWSGTTGTDNSTPIQNAVNAVAALGGGNVVIPAGKYLINSTVVIPANVYLEGCLSSDGYGESSSKLTQLVAGTAGMTMLSTAHGNVGLHNLGLNGNGKANICWSANGSPLISNHTYDNCDFMGALVYCVYLNNVGQIRAHRLQVGGSYPGVTTLIAGVFMNGYCGDSIWTDCYVNSCYPDAPSNTTPPATAPKGVGVWFGAGSSNVTWRGGKIEWCSVGMAIYNSQGINITNVIFDVCRRFAVSMWSDGSSGWVAGSDGVAGQPLATRSISITGCRFLAGCNNAGVNGAGTSGAISAHIHAYQVRGVVIVGNTFRYGADLAYDYNADSPVIQGPLYGILFNNAEKCVIVGNDLVNSVTTSGAQPAASAIELWHDTAAYAQHIVAANALDASSNINNNFCAERHFGKQTLTASWGSPLVLNGVYYWVDDDYGIVRSKSSSPTSSGDGSPYIKSQGVTASSTNSVTNKIRVNVNGTTYYLLASTSEA